MEGTKGFINVNNTLLSNKIGSDITFILSVSNRCPLTRIQVKVSSMENESIVYVRRNSSIELTFNSVYATKEQEIQFMVEMLIPLSESVDDYWDILAIDGINIERSHEDALR